MHLHASGPRPLAEFLAELGRTLDAEADILAALDRWRALSPELVRAVGADAFPPRPLAVVPPQEGAA